MSYMVSSWSADNQASVYWLGLSIDFPADIKFSEVIGIPPKFNMYDNWNSVKLARMRNLYFH